MKFILSRWDGQTWERIIGKKVFSPFSLVYILLCCRSSWSRCWKTPPQCDAATACFTVGMVLGRWWAEFCFLQTWCLESSLSWVLKLEDPVSHSLRVHWDASRSFLEEKEAGGFSLDSWSDQLWEESWSFQSSSTSELWRTLWSGEPSQICASVEAFNWALEFILLTSWHTDRCLFIQIN